MYSSVLVKYIIIREFIENRKVLFYPYKHKILSNVKSPRTSHIYTKDMLVEMALKSTQNTYKRNKSVNEVFLRTNLFI